MRPDDEVRRGAEALGVSAENLPDASEDDEDDVFEVWDINWRSVMLFLGCETRWDCVSRGVAGVLFWLGINYSEAGALLAARSRSEQRRAPAGRLFEDLRIMERAALPIINEVRE